MKQENVNVNSDEFDYQDFKIDEKDFRMWIFDRHNPEDSEIFEPVKVLDKNKLIEQIPAEYTAIREFLANSKADELAQELAEKRRLHRKELEKEYIKEKLAKEKISSAKEKTNDIDSFEIKSENLRNALKQTYENSNAKISFSSHDYSQIKKNTLNPQKRTKKTVKEDSDEENKVTYKISKYKTANICLITLIFALLIFFVGQRYTERKSEDNLSLFYPFTETSSLTESSLTNQEEASSKQPESTTQAENGTLININTASEKELQQLEGIGEIRAARIIEYRETYGKFSSTRDILKVSGIGEKTYEKIKDNITIG